jgi:hypothetical protein
MSDTFEVIRYSADYQDSWNDFVSRAQNATFLFHRNFMDYHAERFEDHSVMLFFESQLVAILPANQKEHKIYSHAGLTYGGLAFIPFWEGKSEIALSFIYQTIFNNILAYYHKQGFQALIYKEILPFYQKNQALSTFLDAESSANQLIHEDIGAVVNLQAQTGFSYLRRRSIKKARSIISNFEVQNSLFTDFWNELLIPQLKNKYNLVPTHTLSEITFLANCFPANIKQYGISYEGKIIAGTVIFEDKQVAHCQYIASNELGKKLFATDFLFHYLITQKYKDFRYFSFGISNWHGSSKINEGLLNWKLSWGAHICKHRHFMMNTNGIYF